MAENVNDIRLSPEMMAMFYGRSLVDILPQSSSSKSGAIRFLGDNKKNITILVNDANYTYVGEQELTVLTKMLDACRINIGDVAIVNLATQNPSEESLVKHLKPIKIISFGTNWDSAVFSIDNRNGYELLTAPPLIELLGDTANSKQLKTKLWGSLKLFFGL